MEVYENELVFHNYFEFSVFSQESQYLLYEKKARKFFFVYLMLQMIVHVSIYQLEREAKFSLTDSQGGEP